MKSIETLSFVNDSLTTRPADMISDQECILLNGKRFNIDLKIMKSNQTTLCQSLAILFPRKLIYQHFLDAHKMIFSFMNFRKILEIKMELGKSDLSRTP